MHERGDRTNAVDPRSGRARPAKPRLAAALWSCGALAVFVIAGLSVATLHGRATGHHDALLALAETDAGVREARIQGWMLIEGVAPADRTATGRQQQLIDELRLAAADAHTGREVALRLPPFADALAAELAALSSSAGAAEAERIAIERREPAFVSLEAALNARAADHVDALRRADDIATAGSMVTLVLAALSVAALAWRFVRLRADAEHAALSSSEARFRNLVSDASDIIAVIDRRLRSNYLSPAAGRMLGYTTGHLIGREIDQLFEEQDRAMLTSRLRALAVSPGVRIALEARLSCRDGSLRHAEVIASNLLHDESIGGLVLNIRDITDRKELENRLRQRALHDALTGLPNREQFIETVEACLTGRASAVGRIALLFMDLDQFKTVNDTLGHDAGDELLVAVARRLQTCAGGDDMVARLSGDEFAVLLGSVRRFQDATDAAKQILDVLKAPIAAGGASVHTGVSIGIAFDDDDIDSVGTLLRRADAAMYAAKRAGGGQYAVHGVEAAPREPEARVTISPDELREAS
jgi:diguanylate cyclase (GGDEF)-like protein/PAS domain S-box-containing protein